MERLDRVELFARTRKLDGTASDRAHRERRAAARIAIHAGQHHAGQGNLLSEAGRDVHRVLAGQRVDDQQDFRRVGDFGDRLHLVHQRLVDVQTPGGVKHDHVETLKLRCLQCPLGDLHRLLARYDRQCRHIGLRAEHRQLLLRGRALDVERRHQDLLAFLVLQAFGDLGGRGRLARTLQAHHHDDGGRSHVDDQVGGFRSQHGGQRVADDLHHLLARRHRPQDILADRLLRHVINELADDRQRDIGFEQRDSHLAHRGADVVLRKRTAPTQLVEYPTETIA